MAPGFLIYLWNFVDEEVLASDGITDLDHYALNPDGELIQDLFL